MKKMTIYSPRLATLLLLSVFIISCSKKDADPPAYADLIIGKWHIKKVSLDNGSIHFPANDCEKKTYYEFTKNKDFIAVSYEMSGSICKPQIVSESPYNVLEDEKKILITDFTTNKTLEIVEVTKQKLSLYFPDAEATVFFEKDL